MDPNVFYCQMGVCKNTDMIFCCCKDENTFINIFTIFAAVLLGTFNNYVISEAVVWGYQKIILEYRRWGC